MRALQMRYVLPCYRHAQRSDARITLGVSVKIKDILGKTVEGSCKAADARFFVEHPTNEKQKQNFGMWDLKIKGRYQEESVKLFAPYSC